MTSSFEPIATARAASFLAEGADEHEPIPEPIDTVAADLELLQSRLEERFEAGRSEGEELARVACEPLKQALREACRALEELQQEGLRAQRRLLAELAIAVAEKLVGEVLAEGPERLAARIESLLTALAGEEPIVVELAPTDAGRLQSLESEDRGYEIVASQELSPGDARVRSGATQLDARVESQLAEARRQLEGLELLQGAEGER